MIDRIFTNLDHNFVNLPKRVILRSQKTLIGFPAYVLPGENTESKIEKSGYGGGYSKIQEEAPYGQPSEVIKSLSDPIIVQNPSLSTTEKWNFPLDGASQQSKDGLGASSTKNPEDDRALPFDGNQKERLFIAIVAIIVVSYITFKFLI
jgi:hypothetical protein